MIFTLLIFLQLIAGQVNAQSASAPLTEQDQIDRLNDHAWSIARIHPDSAVAYAEQAIQRSVNAGNYPKGLMNAHMLLGILHKDRGMFGVSVEHHLKALELAERLKDSLRISVCLNNLGTVNMARRDYPKALDYFQQSKLMEEKLGKDKGNLSIRLFNLGDVYEKMDSLDRAFAFYYNSLVIEEDLKNEEGIFYARLGVGRVDARKGNFAKSKTELSIAASLAEKIKNNLGLCETWLAFGELYLKMNQADSALSFFNRADQHAQQYGYKAQQVEAVKGLSDVYRQRRDFEKAMAALEQSWALQQEINNTEVMNNISDLHAQYQLKKKEEDIRRLEEDKERQEKQIRYERRLLLYMGLMVVTVAGMIVLRFVQSRKRREGA